LIEGELSKICFRRSLVVLAMFSFVLAIDRSCLKLLYLSGIDRVVANEFIEVAGIPTQISPSQDLLSAFSNFGSEM
jgi:hypothetical protein